MKKFFILMAILLLPQVAYAGNLYFGMGVVQGLQQGKAEDASAERNAEGNVTAFNNVEDKYDIVPGTGFLVGWHGKQASFEIRQLSYGLDLELSPANLAPAQYTETTANLISRIGWERFSIRIGAGIGSATLTNPLAANNPKALSVGSGFVGLELIPGKEKDVRFFVDAVVSQAAFRDPDTFETIYRNHTTVYGGLLFVLGKKPK